MHWTDLLLRCIRAAGALMSAAAGIAALLTDGAFPKRQATTTGWYRGLPFSEYRVTRKGALLLAIILLAPSVQFIGDWMKDVGDAKELRRTALDIRNDVDATVRDASKRQLDVEKRAIGDVDATVRDASKRQLDVEKRAIAQETAIGQQASALLKNVDRSVHLAQDQIEQSNKISGNLDRSLNPLTNVSINYRVAIPFDAPELADYRGRLTGGIEEFIHNDYKLQPGLFVSIRRNGAPTEITITSQSTLMPRPDESLAYYLLRYTGLVFSFFQTPQDAAKFVGGQPLPSADLAFVVRPIGQKDGRQYSLEYDLKSGGLQVSTGYLDSDPRSWRSNNKIATVPDLSNAQLAIAIDDSFFPMPPKDGARVEMNEVLSRLRSRIELQMVILRIGTRELGLNRRSEMSRLTSSGPRPFTIYTMVLPQSIDELQLQPPKALRPGLPAIAPR